KPRQGADVHRRWAGNLHIESPLSSLLRNHPSVGARAAQPIEVLVDQPCNLLDYALALVVRGEVGGHDAHGEGVSGDLDDPGVAANRVERSRLVLDSDG